ncbi:DNA replication/repair protein RecF [Marivirga sp. S37H4]|uniref:DNA replication and repair protein RecF n=1 Tax=Marivirga aurantiaca TaxID=2802615 RepID=A0A934WYV5_9BACT|nr:DNA replication/repair protein RecF [Marivirga aurantiaca]MBK6265534.1 DNA replication/repair protein RecF [Marivirga aurantiaca]
MKLQNIRLIQFKNYSKSDFEFVEGINCLLGKNGVGKTNILDAIHYLAFTKSAFNSVDKDNILHNEKFFSIKAQFQKDGKKVDMLCAVQLGEKKMIRWEGKEYERLSDHIGKLPLVMIIPQDTDIVREASEMRRKFFDNLLCQVDQKYLQLLVKYNHLLKQRNALLKSLGEQNRFEISRIEPYDELMIPLAIEIAECRKQLMKQFLPVFSTYYKDLSDGREDVDIIYQTTVDNNFAEIFKSRRQKDFQQGRTTLGAHRDDFLFTIDAYPLKKFGSQGQQKSFVIALKLAQFELLHLAKSQKPLLLLDDIFDKLDDKRIAYLLKMMADGRFGQIFLTDARPERSRNYLDALEIEKKYFQLNDNKDITTDESI